MNQHTTLADDPITIEVISNAIASLVEEMGKTIIRAAFSTNIRERQDCSTALFDAGGRLIAQAEHIPVHLGSLLGITRYVLEQADLSMLRPGDVFIGNDAYTGGGTHLNDIVFLNPIFDEAGVLRAWAANLAHHSDFVDRGHAHIFQEGLRIPPIRLYRERVVQQDVMDLVLLNCQVPHERLSDFAAQLSACWLAETRYREIVHRYGQAVFDRACNSILDHAESKTRAGIRTIPNGVYEASGPFDTDLVDGILDLKVKVIVEDETLNFDFSGNPPQVRAEINMVLTALLATVYYVVRAVCAPDTPCNAGFHRPITVFAPEGLVVNALPPGAVYSRTDVGQRLVDMTLGALARAIPERICAGSTGGILVTTSGVDPRTGRYYVYNESNGGGMGARQGFDGLDAVQVHTTNTANLPVEAAELEYPIQIMSYELVRDSGGAGAFRGGMTMRKTIRVRDHDAVLWSGGTCAKVAPVGLYGGGDGTLCRADLSPGAQPIVKRKGALRAGESVAVQAASGAGFGDPRARDRAAVARDLREDRISPAAAREIYGLDRDTVDEIVAARG